MQLTQKTKYLGSERWQWSVWLEGAKDELSKVRKVRYLLHPTFDPPTRWVDDRRSKFRLDCAGWGEFTIRADVFLADEEVLHLKHELRLEYPAAKKKTPTTRNSKSSSVTHEQVTHEQVTHEQVTGERAGEPIEGGNWLALAGGRDTKESVPGSEAAAQRGHVTFIHGIANKPSAESLLRTRSRRTPAWT
jgi:transcription initiation factor IIF auxiliary subunit